MRKLLPAVIAVGTLLPAIGVASAGAITPRTVAQFKAAAAATSAVEPVVYICKQRYWSGKRYCYWRPSGYHWGWRWRWPRWWR